MLIVLLSFPLSSLAWQASEVEQNKAIAKSFFEEVIDQGQLDRYAESHAADFVAHAGERTATLEEDMTAAKEERKALPDLHIKILQMLAERDLVAVYWMASGTNTQEGMGFPATGRRISIPGMTIFRFQNGKIREEWGVFDMYLALRQAGLLAPGGQKPATQP
jgi:steroid delta-isomerase-like uncharacterized protein